MKFRVGTAATTITPPVGSRMAAFPRGPERLPRRAQGVRDPLKVRALAMDDGYERVLLASVDLCILREESVFRIRKRVCAECAGFDPGQIVLAATHTHSGAETSFLFGASPGDREVLNIEELIAGTLIKAWEDIEPAGFSYASTDLEISHNRRVRNVEGRSGMALEFIEGVTTGPVDPEMLVMQFSRAGGTVKAILFHYTAHALTLGPGNTLFSADFPGKACRRVEEAFPHSLALFVNGAAGNVHPRECMRTDTEALDAVGKTVGQAVIETAGIASRVAEVSLRMRSDRLEFNHRTNPELRVSAEIGVLGIGPVILGWVPGELYVEFQLRFKAAIAPHPGTLIGYANGWPGYIPTLDAYREGGYGVDIAQDDPSRYSRTSLPEGAGEKMLNRLVELAGKST